MGSKDKHPYIKYNDVNHTEQGGADAGDCEGFHINVEH